MSDGQKNKLLVVGIKVRNNENSKARQSHTEIDRQTGRDREREGDRERGSRLMTL